ncbi:FAD-dependent oxidoreductase [Virgibacillus phage Mimir87]|nr:FAD-dependent oxidoreductase [Virgibacillus phage Mimir87]
MRKLSVLVSGGSIAGLTSAYWLNHNGFDVTIVEKAEGLRSGGYPIDLRGTAVDIVKKMNIYEGLKNGDLNGMKLTFLNKDGTKAGQIVDAMKDNDDIEVPRGDLTNLLYSKVKDKGITFYFKDSIKEIVESGNEVNVQFESGKKENFDIVIGADGVHSNTRKLTFSSEENYTKYLGYWFTGFTIKNDRHLFKEALINSEAGRTTALYGAKNPDTVTAFLIHYDEEPPYVHHRDEEKQKQLVRERFNNMGGITPEILIAMNHADDFYYDVTNQIIMDTWSKGRTVLVGDAAYAPSFLTGQGTSLAIIGAYYLSNELAKKNDIETAFSSYEEIARPFVEENQNRVDKDSYHFAYPKNEEHLAKRDQMLSEISLNKNGREEKNSDVNKIPRYID